MTIVSLVKQQLTKNVIVVFPHLFSKKMKYQLKAGGCNRG
jgi:hypothetical protein